MPIEQCGDENVLCRLNWQRSKPGVARPRDAEDAVGVRLVVVADAAGVVHELDELVDLRVEDARVLGVRDHQAGGALGQRPP